MILTHSTTWISPCSAASTEDNSDSDEEEETEDTDPWWEDLSEEIRELAEENFLNPEDYDDRDEFFDMLEIQSGEDLTDERYSFF